MSDQDRHFFDQFLLVLGLLVAFTIAMFILARFIHGRTQGEWIATEPQAMALLEERIAPIGNAAAEGEDDVAAPSPEEELLAAAEPAEVTLSGAQVYNQACFACHAAGVAGAPKVGDIPDWTARTQQGIDVLNAHAINGYQGEKGYMPPKGGRTDLSDEEVIAAVQYMIDESS